MEAARETFALYNNNQQNKNISLLIKPLLTQDAEKIFYPGITGPLCGWCNLDFVQAIHYLALANAESLPAPKVLSWLGTGLQHLQVGLDALRHLYPAEPQQLAITTHVYRELWTTLGYAAAVDTQDPAHHLGERQRKAAILKTVQHKTGLYRTAFQLGWLGRGGALEHLSAVETAGTMLGLCAEILEDLEGKKASICAGYTHNELIDLFMSSLNTFGKTCVRFKLFTPALKEVYTLFILRFKNNLELK